MKIGLLLMLSLSSLLAVPAAVASSIERWFIADAKALEFFATTGSRADHIDHSAWDAFLTIYLQTDHPSGVHRLGYKAVTADDRSKLHAYLDSLQRIDPRQYPRSEQFAFWINLYNATTVSLILDHVEVSSIRDIGGGFFSVGPWDQEVLKVSGQVLSLNDVEHRIVRPLFKDHRAHFALNCASVGCPNLSPVAYRSETLNAQLEQAEGGYLAHPRAIRFEGERLVLSSIFSWYREDFVSDEAALAQFLATRAPSTLRDRLHSYRGRIRYEYDWSLNAP